MKFMKYVSLSFIFVFMMFGVILKVNAKEWFDDFNHTIDSENKTITLTSYIGLSENVTVKSLANYEGEEYKIVASRNLFRDNDLVKNVTIEDGVIFPESISNLFYRAKNLEKVNIGKVDMDNTTNTSYMFFGCSSLKDLDLSNLNTSNVTNMNGMIAYCDNLKTLNISSFDTSKVKYMDSIFNSTNNIEKIVIGPKTDFRVKSNDEAQGSNFGRGTWKKESDGKLYTSVQICEASSNGKAAGTYTKVSNMSSEISPDFTVNLKLGNYSKIKTLSSTSSEKFILVDNNKSLLYKFDVANGNKEYTDKVTVLLENSVIDVEGNKYNLKMTFDNFFYEDSKVDDYNSLYLNLLTINGNNLKVTNYTYSSIDEFLEKTVTSRTKINDDKSALSYDVEINVVDKDGKEVEGSYIFSAYDLDIAAYQDTDTDYKFLNNEYGYGTHSEGINLIKGYDKKTITFAKTHSFLTKSSINDITRITGTRSDNITEYSEFIVKADAKDFKFKWTSGKPAYTLLFAYYQPKSVDIENRNVSEKKLIVGSKFELYDSNNKLVTSWTTENGPKSIFLNPGQYTVKQISVPDDYKLANEEIFYVDIDDTLTYDGKNVDKIIIYNDVIVKEDEETTPEKEVEKKDTKVEEVKEASKCSSKVINGKRHYYDTKGNEIEKSEWSNKCQEPVPTGAHMSFIAIGVGVIFIVSSIIISKKQNKLRNI